MHANVEKHLRSLKALGLPVDSWDVIAMHMIVSKLDPITIRDWKGVKYENKLPTLSEMFKFFNERCQVLQNIKRDNVKHNKVSVTNSMRTRQSSQVLLATDGENCFFLQGFSWRKIMLRFFKIFDKRSYSGSKKA